MGLFRKKQHEQVRRPRITDDSDIYAFRRSRTMTGSLSDSVKAAAEPRADLQSDRLKHHTLKKQRRHLVLYLFATGAVIFGIVTLINNAAFSTEAQYVAGASTGDMDRYRQVVDQYLQSHPNERFSFALRTDSLTQTVQEKFPEVKSVSLETREWLKSALVTIVPRRPVASWTIGSVKYYIDEHGVAFSHNLFSEPSLVVEDKTGIDPTSSSAVVSERMLRYIGRLVALLSSKGYKVEKLELPPATSREVDVHLVGLGYSLKTSLDRDPAGQVADIVQAVKFLKSHNLNPTYADLRVSSRLYYK